MTSSYAFARRVAASSAVAMLLLISACGGAKSPYTFSTITKEIATDGHAVIDVRIVYEPSGEPVANAVIFETRFDMSPESMASMTAPVEPQGSPEPGVYRFMVTPNMAGRWALTLKAKVQGVDETVTGTIVVTAR